SSSTSPAMVQVVNKAGTTSVVTADVNPAVFGQTVTFTATISVVTPGAGTPTGNVDFKEGSLTLGSGGLNNGVATFSTSSLKVGTHQVQAIYTGDGNFMASSKNTPVSEVIGKAGTTVSSITSSTNPTVFGQATTFTATVTPVAPGAGTPT